MLIALALRLPEAMDIRNLRIPEPLNIYSNTLAEDYRKWREQIDVYLTACGADEKPKKVIKCIILNCAGPGIISAAKQFVYAEGEHEEDPGELLKKIAAYCNPQKHESLDAYLSIYYGISTGNQVLVLITFKLSLEAKQTLAILAP